MIFLPRDTSQFIFDSAVIISPQKKADREREETSNDPDERALARARAENRGYRGASPGCSQEGAY